MDPAMEIEAAVLAKQQPMLLALERAGGHSEVQRFYSNSVLFLTGGTGFLGKQLLEKLFRSCQISKVYLLLRPKKGKDIKLRIKEMVKDPLFDTLRKKNQNFMEKISGIEGDISEIRLGIKDQDWKLLTEEVNVIFHVAATTRFDEPLQTATLINIRGTREAILLGKECKKLWSYVHVSTAYTYAITKLAGKEVHEKFYKAPIAPAAMISMAESMDADRLTNITPELIKDWPNTYTFTKAVSEELVRDMSAGLPICIVRPGVVLATHFEPTPGWLDMSCMYGASGFIVASGLGVLHTAYVYPDTIIGVAPGDYVTNATIVAARETATNQAKGGDHTKIYTVTCMQKNPVAWKKFLAVLRNEATLIPSPMAVYYCFGVDTSIKLLYLSICLFLQFVPAYVADFICLLTGKKRVFAKLAHKAYKMCNILSFFTTHEWTFTDENVDKLYNNLTELDQTIFNFDYSKIDWTDYTLIWCVGIRKYIFKDGLKNTKYAVKKQKYLKLFHYAFMTLYAYGLYKLVYLVYFCLCQLFFALVRN